LKDALCLLNTSLFEGFPNTFLEALSVGTPIVTMRNIDPDNIINKNNLGIVCDDDSAIISALSNIHNFDYSNFHSHSRKYLTENHNPENLVRKLLTKLQ